MARLTSTRRCIWLDVLRQDSRLERRLRAVITSHPERFRLEKSIVLNSNDAQFQGMTLKAFRNTQRNENAERRLELDILMLRRSLQANVPWGTVEGQLGNNGALDLAGD